MESAQSNGVRAPFGDHTNIKGRGQSFAHLGVQIIKIIINNAIVVKYRCPNNLLS
jgi:hypothetical protein